MWDTGRYYHARSQGNWRGGKTIHTASKETKVPDNCERRITRGFVTKHESIAGWPAAKGREKYKGEVDNHLESMFSGSGRALF